MSYTKHNWVNDNAPAINALHLNEMEDGIKANDTRVTANEMAIHNLGAGQGAAIKGSKPLSDIYAIAGNVNDIYINNDKATPTYGHGYISNGQGAGASNWSDIGMVLGDKGDKGDAGPRGLMGLGLDFEHAYADKATMVAANPSPEVGEVHLTIDTGDLWVYDNPTPPHDASGADWHDVGHVAGPQGDKGDKGDQGDKGDTGPQGPAGSATSLADQAETDAGTINDKGVTPNGLANTPSLLHVLPTGEASIHGTGEPMLVGYSGAFRRFRLNGDATGAYIYAGAASNYYQFSTDSLLMARDSASHILWSLGKTTVGTSFASHGAAFLFTSTGGIKLIPKAGEKALLNNKSIVTGALSGTTLTLTI